MPSSVLVASRRARVARAAAGVTLVAGFADLARGGITFSAVLLAVGYLAFVPLALLSD